VLGLTAVLAATLVSTARADGDPASDVLPTDSIYFPISAPSDDAWSALLNAVGAVYARGERIRVAVVATPDDLGAIPSLMNKPDDYARFRGQELAGFYVGPLLIAMPGGWGVYDGGRPVSAEDDVLSDISVNGSSVDNLVRSAAAAVQGLEAAGALASPALASPDVKAPYVYPQPVTIHPGRNATFLFRLLDDSNRASVAVTVHAAGKRLASLTLPLGATNYPNARSISWSVPKTIPKQGVKLCMSAADAAGNRSATTCVALKVGR
jgi:hypothetical protein